MKLKHGYGSKYVQVYDLKACVMDSSTNLDSIKNLLKSNQPTMNEVVEVVDNDLKRWNSNFIKNHESSLVESKPHPIDLFIHESFTKLNKDMHDNALHSKESLEKVFQYNFSTNNVSKKRLYFGKLFSYFGRKLKR